MRKVKVMMTLMTIFIVSCNQNNISTKTQSDNLKEKQKFSIPHEYKDTTYLIEYKSDNTVSPRHIVVNVNQYGFIR